LLVGDFAVLRILIFANGGTKHSSFIVLLLHFSYFYLIIRKSRKSQFLFLELNIQSTRVLYYTSEAITVAVCVFFLIVSAEISCFTVLSSNTLEHDIFGLSWSKTVNIVSDFYVNLFTKFDQHSSNNVNYMWSHQAKAVTWVYLKMWLFFPFFHCIHFEQCIL